VGIISAGYLLGEKLQGSVDRYLLPIVAAIVAASLVPIVLEVFRDRREKRTS
jgi:membrane-associated protein